MLRSQEDTDHVSTVFSALGGPTRLKILQVVSESQRPLHIKAVADALELNYAAVYRHVEVLKKANLLKIYEVGRSRVLSLLHLALTKELVELALKVTQ